MAVIDLIIKIDEEDYKLMKHNVEVYNPLCPLSQEEIVTKIANGTPLPRHGRLIDADELKTHFVGTELGTDLAVYLEPTIVNAPTIIESNKE